jgi:hypothetical protein
MPLIDAVNFSYLIPRRQKSCKIFYFYEIILHFFANILNRTQTWKVKSIFWSHCFFPSNKQNKKVWIFHISPLPSVVYSGGIK